MKLKFFYHISFWFGVIYLLLKLLAVPAMIVVFQAQGIHITTLGQFGMSEIIFLLAGPVSGILVGVLISTISLALIRNKIVVSKILNIATGMISIAALVTVVLVSRSIFLIISTQSTQSLVGIDNQLSTVAYPIFPIFFLVSLILLTVGYMKEKLKVSPRKYLGTVSSLFALLIVIVLKLVEIFH